MNINIMEVIDRSRQGVTRPFLCRGDDGQLYYVKGKGAGFRALISEWIAGSLGQRLGLPIPDFRQATIPSELIQLSARPDIGDLGVGTGFASKLIQNADELSFLFIGQMDETLRARILLFDWWTANEDRTLTENGGNPNILWVHRDHAPHVIDHNLAFDDSALTSFWGNHVFAASRALWSKSFRETEQQRMEAALGDLDLWWQAMPPEWTEIEGEVTLESVRKLLWRFKNEPASFWEAV